ncbi:MAG: DNA methyltransferase [Candidatus Cloacimonetes bacterium]|jgi:DNA modification methylase|nr:HEAT repeat domain-containing protein [Candidatus Cloacimonadota bacterium]MDY0299365.1 DNA methyltransferase [Candidatus Cloacimonadaceae bacterium]MCB5277994.1 HEAT repeat domain-containing protein [Candidatus Cloacimonadota bacterium]MCK9331943.1 HEAT repeat domain-containing protein [Candidatus Cloacimonadota bacterium]MDD3282581.1 DNA methyltransferase [Candidatus Cloacimonadota bacterium]
MNINYSNQERSKTIDIKTIIQNSTDNSLITFLNKLGKIDDIDNIEPLFELLKSRNESIRQLAIKNLAKTKRQDLVSLYVDILTDDPSSDVRREAVSAIGRTRNEINIPYLVSLLDQKDPKIVMQAMRGLLPFKKKPEIKRELNKLINHPNEMIQAAVKKELRHTNIRTNVSYKQQLCSPKLIHNLIVHGDTIESMSVIPDESIHLTFTSPPYYNARDYSVYSSYKEYLDFLVKVFKETYRITKEGRFFILNTSPVIVKRISRQHSSKRYPIPYDIHPLLIDMGWEFIDDIVWVKPEASVKNRVAGFEQHRKPLAYKPNARTECIMVYRKSTDKLLDWNMRCYPDETVEASKVRGKYETSNVWNIDPTFDKTHTAVFPIELCNRIISLYSYIGDLVFDPFGGSGTLGRAAIQLNRRFFLTEIKSEYIERMMQFFKQTDISYLDQQPMVMNIESFKRMFKEL